MMETIRMDARNVTRSTKAIFPKELPLTAITIQLAQISAITQTLSKGSDGLGSASDKDETIQDPLSHTHALLLKFDDPMHVIRQEIPLVMTAWSTTR